MWILEKGGLLNWMSYIGLFHTGAVKEAIETLRENNVNSYVLDLRNNSGDFFLRVLRLQKTGSTKV